MKRLNIVVWSFLFAFVFGAFSFATAQQGQNIQRITDPNQRLLIKAQQQLEQQSQITGYQPDGMTTVDPTSLTPGASGVVAKINVHDPAIAAKIQARGYIMIPGFTFTGNDAIDRIAFANALANLKNTDPQAAQQVLNDLPANPMIVKGGVQPTIVIANPATVEPN